MSRLSRVLRKGEGCLLFLCPGCGYAHLVYVDRPGRPNWTWNGDVDRPTFSPSILVRTGRAVDPQFEPEPGDPPEICHSFVREGRIEFCGDSTHALAGQTVDLPAYDGDEP